MADGRFLIAAGGCLGFSFVLFLLLKIFPNVFEKVTSLEGIAWMYSLHMIGAVIGVILLLIGIFKRKPSS